MRSDEEKILDLIERVQDFGVCGGQGDLVENKTLAWFLCENGCVVAETIPKREKRYTKERAENGRT